MNNNSMAISKILVFLILFTIIKISSATTNCEIQGSECTYQVTCMFHPGSAQNPTCSGEPNVTFIIMSSTANIVTTGFFGATNFDSRVRVIEAVNNTWISLGTLAFRYYQKVKQINLSGNLIHEVQDNTFKTLMVLKYLNLSKNAITELYPESFFIADSKYTALETLDLSYNAISHLSDEVLSHLPNLLKLYLQHNKLKSLADNCFGNQKSLVALHLEENYINRLNMSLINLKQLKYLDVSHNYLKTISGYETNRLQALEKVNISNNVLQSIESNCFVQSLNLKVVDLSFNLISSVIDNVMFAGNVELQYLDLYANRISGIEGNSFKYNKLTYLNLENNTIAGEIKDNTFAGLQNITKLDLSRQNITVLRNYAFVEMKMLLTLNLSRNNVSEIENFSFCNSSVSIVDLSYNNISNLNFLNDSLYNLTELYLNNNNLTVLNENAFQQQMLIKTLDLSGNKIILIKQRSLPLQNLQYLNLVGNRITGALRRNIISPAKYLRFLDLSYLNINEIDNLTFFEMPVLARLNLSHNVIENIGPDNFRGMDNLFSIDISFNKLTDLQFNNSLLTKLKAAYLNNNKLTNISRIFTSTCNFFYLDISYNGFSDLTYVDSKLFPELQSLHISHNNIEKFNSPGVNSLTNLIDLNLSSNKIKYIDLSFYKDLLIVDLSNNYLSIINSTFFNNINFVQSIDLSQNNISDLPPGTFQNMQNLKLLNLSSNHISKLRYGSLKGLHKTEILDVSSNWIDSLDVHVFHECTELKTLVIDYNRIKTLDIDKLVLMTQKKLRTLSLGGNPISCQEIIRNVPLKNLSYAFYKIEVTSKHKIYHEDNVHGIKCGESDMTSTAITEEIVKTNDNGDSSSSIVIVVWCSLLTVTLLAIGLAVFVTMRRKASKRVFYGESTVHLRNSLELDNSEYNVIN